MFGCEKLEVWERAIDFADVIYTVSRGFPSDERSSFTNQIRRAAVSISSNIVEGSAFRSRKESVRLVDIATGSLAEVISHARISRKKGYLTTEEFSVIYEFADEQNRMLSGLRRSLRGDV